METISVGKDHLGADLNEIGRHGEGHTSTRVRRCAVCLIIPTFAGIFGIAVKRIDRNVGGGEP